MSGIKLTETQERILAAAYDWLSSSRGDPGMYIVGAGQHRSMRWLVAKGIMYFSGYGRAVDEWREDDVPIYVPTEYGQQLAIERGLIGGDVPAEMMMWGLCALHGNPHHARLPDSSQCSQVCA